MSESPHPQGDSAAIFQVLGASALLLAITIVYWMFTRSRRDRSEPSSLGWWWIGVRQRLRRRRRLGGSPRAIGAAPGPTVRGTAQVPAQARAKAPERQARRLSVLPGQRYRFTPPKGATGTIEAPRSAVLEAAPVTGPRFEAKMTRSLATCTKHSAFFGGECSLQGAPEPALVVRGAALRGVDHAYDCTEGQDAVAAAWDGEHAILHVAVADGLGSLPNSAVLARDAALRAVDLSMRRPMSDPVHAYAKDLYQEVSLLLKEWLEATREGPGASTLVTAQIVPHDHGAQVTVFGVGDSEAWLLHGGRWTVLHHERGSGRDNATRYVPGYPEPTVFQADVPGDSVLLLATDGVAAALDTHRSPLARFLAKRWIDVPSSLDFLGDLSYDDGYSTDDRGAVAVWIKSVS